MLAAQLVALTALVTMFILLYFSYFSTNTKEEGNTDTDFFLITTSTESEKEIGSFDDLILVFIVILYVFAWFFYIYCWSILSYFPEMIFVFYLFPLLYYVIVGVPFYLAYDFGVFFLSYLGGAGKSSFVFGELFYDYVAFLVFYIRKLIHAVRLVIAVGVCFELQEFIMLYNFDCYFFCWR